jgi:hypothetical protein
MWAVHQASKPENVAIRAGVHERSFYYWTRHHRDRAPWLADVLYGGVPPGDAADFALTEDMHAFRKEATIPAIARAAERLLEEV